MIVNYNLYLYTFSYLKNLVKKAGLRLLGLLKV
jgi:hypothetical protein